MAKKASHKISNSKINAAWTNYIDQILARPWPTSVEWQSSQDIIAVLGRLAESCGDANWLFLPDGGGITVLAVKEDVEADCLQLETDRDLYVAKPASLAFYTFAGGPEWSYFDVELHSLDPITAYPDGRTEFVQRRNPALRNVKSRGRSQKAIVTTVDPEGSSRVRRLLGGRIVIFSKGSPFTLDPSTLDGRHDFMTRIYFHRYVRCIADCEVA